MTAEEAIKKITERHCTEGEHCTDNCMNGDEFCEYSLAIEALEKQIPKKPIFANNMMTKDKFLMCPCCEFRLPDSLVFLKTRCWNCGQKLDWSV